MAWFKKERKPRAAERVKLEIPADAWEKCEECAHIDIKERFVRALNVCPNCGHDLPPRSAGERQYLLNLASVLDGWTIEVLDYLWNLRNRIPAHGREHLDAETRHELAEASVTAARLAYDTLKAVTADTLRDGPHELWRMGVLASGLELHMQYERRAPDS